MYIHSANYDFSLLMRENLHVHTSFSRCAARDMTVEAIVRLAEQAGLERIALVDHYNTDIDDEIFMRHVDETRECLANLQTSVKVLVGCECSAYGVGKHLGGSKFLESLDYRLFSCVHYHMAYWEHPQECTAEGYARHILDVATSIMRTGNADCIAHPFALGYIKKYTDYQKIADAFTDEMLHEMLSTAIENKTALELNNPFSDPYGMNRRMFAMGMKMGVVFNYGTDAHRHGEIATLQRLEDVKAALL